MILPLSSVDAAITFHPVRPYYIHQMDLVKGTRHFHTKLEKGIEIMAGLRGHTSALQTPYFVIDLPGGKGKVPVGPEYLERQGNRLLLRNILVKSSNTQTIDPRPSTMLLYEVSSLLQIFNYASVL